MADIPTADWSWINAAADRFERACSRGRRPRIEDYLGDLGPERVPAILDELLRVECELRRGGARSQPRKSTVRRFPDHVGVVDAVFEANLPEPADAEVEELRREEQGPADHDDPRRVAAFPLNRSRRTHASGRRLSPASGAG